MANNKRKPATGSIYFDYKDIKSLQKFVNQFGQIETRKRTGLTEMQQRRLAKVIKRAPPHCTFAVCNKIRIKKWLLA
jgi:ribosomal protein S18